MKISRSILAALLFCLAEGVGAQSLWSPGFTGYLTGKSSLQAGDLVSVTIDTNTKLTYNSSNVSSRTITLQFSGGSGSSLLSLLPGGTSGEKASLKGGEEIKLSTKLVARVERRDKTGQAFVQGSRTLEVNGRQEMVGVSGWLDPSMLSDGGKSIAFDDLADSKLVYSSTLVQSKPVLTQADITSILAQSTAPPTATSPASPAPAPAATPSAAAAPGASAPAAGTAAPSAGFQLSEAAKRRLLLEYLNKMLDLIFTTGAP